MKLRDKLYHPEIPPNKMMIWQVYWACRNYRESSCSSYLLLFWERTSI